jgi:probable phosphoglycerate mutase
VTTEYRQYRFQVPPGATEVFLVRHGESAPARLDDPPPRWCGQDDPPLSPEGREQAERVARRLAVEPLDALYVTPLRRTHETATPLAQRLGLPLRIVEDLREVHLGEWEGGLFRKLTSELHPTALRMFEEERWDVIPGAEKQEDLEARVFGALRQLHADHPDQRVAVFAHGGVIGCLLARVAGARPFAFVGADNASVSQVVVHGERVILRRFNDTAHLDQRFTLVPEPLN